MRILHRLHFYKLAWSARPSNDSQPISKAMPLHKWINGGVCGPLMASPCDKKTNALGVVFVDGVQCFWLLLSCLLKRSHQEHLNRQQP